MLKLGAWYGTKYDVTACCFFAISCPALFFGIVLCHCERRKKVGSLLVAAMAARVSLTCTHFVSLS